MFRRILETWFCEYKPVRRYLGGHWERWYIDFPVCGDHWIKVNFCSKFSGKRPGLGRGTPTCENHL